MFIPQASQTSLHPDERRLHAARLGQISRNVPAKSPVGIFEEKGANNFF
jgi:hypothetical protein